MQLIRIIKKFRQILSRHQKIRILELCVLMMIGGFMEMLSVSLILPFMEAVMNPDRIMSNTYVQLICGWIGLGNYRTFLVFLALIMAILYILKNVFLLFELRIQAKFVYGNRFSTQIRLLQNYLSRPYEYFLGINSGEVLRVIGEDTQNAFTLLTNVISFFSEMVVSVFLVGTIFVIAPGITLGMAALLLVLICLIMWILRPILNRAGKRGQESYAGMQQWLLQAIQGIREEKIMRKEKFFQDQFQKNGWIYVRASYEYHMLSQVPRHMIEAAAMSSFLVVIAFMIYRGMELEAVVPILSAVAMAAIRLLPSVNRISLQLAGMAYNEPMLDKMIENLKDAAAYETVEVVSEKGSIRGLNREIEMRGASYRYPTGEKDVLHEAGMKITKGQAVGIVGASGSGKSTAVDLLLGLLKPQNGSILVDGTDIRLDMEGWLSEIGYIPQSIFLLDGSIRDNVAFGVPAEEVRDEDVWRALEEAALVDFVRGLSSGLDTQLGERGMRISGGQRQRIGIARALYTDPEVLIFDEATSALDNETEAAIMDSIDHLHGTKTMVIIAHRLTTISNCDVVYEIRDGKAVETALE